MANPVGRPPLWKNKEELQEQIDAYFLSITDDNGEYKKPPTITGLAVHLGTNRETLCNYEEKDEFFDTIKRAKGICEQWVEENAMVGKANPTFSIFNLKNNYGWKDKTEQQLDLGEDTLKTINVIKDNGEKRQSTT